MSSKPSENDTDLPQNDPPCGLLRRIAALLYDGLLLLAILMLAALIVVIPLGAEVPSGNPFFQLYLLTVSWLYFALGWRGGQTLGMRSWRIRIHSEGERPGWLTTVARFLAALLSWVCFGLGFLWSLFRKDRATWHDLLSDSRLTVTPKRQRKAV
ncbi:RDD family protein [Wenzhouxiangella marina]|uniref:RDD domain containing protein n=1 Tax=Wenzhouxiangella marina TaxID=1579979 RepID=A0A0K0XTA2_9GAMM|nr:RDD family protein [Wenzhouxiangella marina]AKS40852.1 RDD domain containing protein [Wenzhouxiangella marina]MBB6087726.1 putative RDD family membrane protein YckC [Wenzhouxiangella marina]